MEILDELKYLNYRRKNVFFLVQKIVRSLLIKDNKKVRMPINNSDHWTSNFFKVRGTLTVSENASLGLNHIYDNVFETREKFLKSTSFVKEKVLPFVGAVSMLCFVVLLDNVHIRAVPSNQKKK